MNKKVQINFYKKQLQTSRELQEVSMQNYNIATRLESEAKVALDLLGNKPERKKQQVLSNSLELELLASLTQTKKTASGKAV